nr:hypothetical protein F11D5.4 - Caenorhabditis elegans [Caenorhabditis elegans]
MLHLPESPKWLIQQDKLDEAKMSIKFYHGKKCTIDEIVTSFIKERNLTNKNKISLKEVWDNETLREGLKIVFAVLLFLEFDTSYVTSVYTIDFHKSAGFTVQQAASINEEKTPLIKNRARTFGAKRNSILNTPRSRVMKIRSFFQNYNFVGFDIRPQVRLRNLNALLFDKEWKWFLICCTFCIGLPYIKFLF